MNPIFLELILLIVLYIAAGFFSAAEIAIASFGVNKIEELKDKEDKKAFAFEKIQKEPNYFFGTIQIVTTVSLLGAAMLALHIISKIVYPLITNSASEFLSEYSKAFSYTAALLVSVFFTLVTGILIPKALGFKYAESIGKSTVNLFILLTNIFKYPVILINKTGNIILKPFKEKTDFSQTRFSEDEIRIIISEGVKSGALDETEQEIIDNIFEFNDLRANEVMIPRTEMVAVEIENDISEIKDEVIKTGHSLIPVYEENVDNIVGVLHTKDFMKSLIDAQPVSIKSLMRPAYFIPETKLISEILKEMQKRGERLAIVMDEYGGTEGIITIEDILEEIVGDLGDNASEIPDFNKLPDGKFYILGSMPIDDFNDSFNIELPSSDEYNTIAGFIADQTGKILNTGEIFIHEGLTFELIKKIRQKMVQFKVYSDEIEFGENVEEY